MRNIWWTCYPRYFDILIWCCFYGCQKCFFLNFLSKLFLMLLLLFLLMNRATIDDLVFLGDFKMKTTIFVIRFFKDWLSWKFCSSFNYKCFSNFCLIRFNILNIVTKKCSKFCFHCVQDYCYSSRWNYCPLYCQSCPLRFLLLIVLQRLF